jgi:hypothetical protein
LHYSVLHFPTSRWQPGKTFFLSSFYEYEMREEIDALSAPQEISLWREALARSIALGNSALSQKDLNFSVQRTIDRLLFLRICEDRAIEEYGRLKALLKDDGVYAHLLKLFAEADERYNSGIFYFQTSPTPPMSPATTAWWSWCSPCSIFTSLHLPAPITTWGSPPDRGHGPADRQAGVRALRADRGGDWDCGDGSKIGKKQIFNM